MSHKSSVSMNDTQNNKYTWSTAILNTRRVIYAPPPWILKPMVEPWYMTDSIVDMQVHPGEIILALTSDI